MGERLTARIRRFLRLQESTLLVLLSVLGAMSVIWMCTGYWPGRYNPYNSYVRQADAWLHGTLHLPDGEYLQWLELAIYEGRYYVSFPPFPSYVMLPFTALLGMENVPDGYIALAFALVGAIYACRLYRQLTGSDRHMPALVLFLLLGNGWLFLTVNGWVWFIAQNMCFTLSLAALYYAARGKGALSLGCWACAVGCRPMVGLYLPLLLWLLVRALRERCPGQTVFQMVLHHLHWALPPLVIGGSYMVLNQLRFGSILEFGHNYLPEFTRLSTGQFSLSYFANNFRSILRLPVWYDGGSPVSLYGIECMGFYMVNPILLVIGAAWLRAVVRKRRGIGPALVMLPLMAAAHLFILCCHHTMGGQQFGNRYLVDMLPWLFAGMLLWMPRGERFVRYTLPFACFGTALNIVGTIMSYNGWM